RAGTVAAPRRLLAARLRFRLPRLVQRRTRAGRRRTPQTGPPAPGRYDAAGAGQRAGAAGRIGPATDVSFDMATKRKSSRQPKQRGSTMYGALAGLLIGLIIAAIVAFYVTKAPMPFVRSEERRVGKRVGRGARS